MYSIERIESLIAVSEYTLIKYETFLKKNPYNLFDLGVVKNTKEQLTELRANLVFEKQKREKEIIDLKLKGNVARVGKLPLELLGNFAKALSDCIVEASRKYQYGNKVGIGILSNVKKTINLQFDRLIPGSTHIMITANTSPDLFGNSLIESAMVNTFNILNVSNDSELMEKSEAYGGSGIKKLNDILSLSIKNNLEFDLEWEAPNSKRFSWSGNKENMLKLNNSISRIQIDIPIEQEITGIIVLLSLKGQLEIKEGNKKPIKISFPMNMLEEIKSLQLGDICTVSVLQRLFKNNITSEEKITFELKKIMPVLSII